MLEPELHEELCKDCGQPLFLDKEECKAFIEERLSWSVAVAGQQKKLS